MVFAINQWPAAWTKPWAPVMVLDSPAYQELSFKGANGLIAWATSFDDQAYATVPAQTWQAGLRPDSVSVDISRAGTSGAVIEVKVYDADGMEIGSVSPTNYPPGATTVVVPLLFDGYDLGSVSIRNLDWPTPIDVTILDIRVGASELKPEWTHHIGCMEF